jgi:hypothetical protein
MARAAKLARIAWAALPRSDTYRPQATIAEKQTLQIGRDSR